MLEIYYPLMQGARIKGVIKLGTHEITGLRRHKIIQELFLKMADKLSAAAQSDSKPTDANTESGYVVPAKQTSLGVKKAPSQMSSQQVFKRSLVCPRL